MRFWSLVFGALLFAAVGTTAMAAQPIIGRVHLDEGQLYWLGSSVPAGWVNFVLSSDSSNVTMVHDNGSTYPVIVRDPSDAPPDSSTASEDTLVNSLNRLEASYRAEGLSNPDIAHRLGEYLHSLAEVSSVHVDGAWITYTLTSSSLEHQYAAVPVQVPSRAAQLTAYIQPMIDDLRNRKPVMTKWSGQAAVYLPSQRAELGEAVAAIHRGELVPTSLIAPELVNLIRRPVDRQTLRQSREE